MSYDIRYLFENMLDYVLRNVEDMKADNKTATDFVKKQVDTAIKERITPLFEKVNDSLKTKAQLKSTKYVLNLPSIPGNGVRAATITNVKCADASNANIKNMLALMLCNYRIDNNALVLYKLYIARRDEEKGTCDIYYAVRNLTPQLIPAHTEQLQNQLEFNIIWRRTDAPLTKADLKGASTS